MATTEMWSPRTAPRRPSSTISFEEGMVADRDYGPSLPRPRSGYTNLGGDPGPGSMTDTTASWWRRLLLSTRPLYGSAGLVTAKSAVLCLVAMPLVLFCIGVSRCLYIAAP